MIALRFVRRAISSCAAAIIISCMAVADAEAQPVLAIERMLAEVQLNGRQLPEPVILLKDKNGRLYVREAVLRDWRLSLPTASPVRFEGESYYRIDGMSSLRLRFSPADQSLVIDAAPNLFERQRAAFYSTDLPPMTASAEGAFINYDLFIERTDGKMKLNGLAELSVFTPSGAGASSFVGQASGEGRPLLRLETSWTIDRPDKLTSIRLGDSITRGAYGAAPIRFAGIQFARNFAVQPGFVTLPMPMLSGSAALPSVAEVYVNNVLQGSRDVQPGPFELGQVPIQTGGGTVQLVTTDLLGRQVITTQNYYASAGMLREGLHDFSYEAGFLRKGFGVKGNSYGTFIASGTHRYGFSNWLTGEASLQFTKSVQSAGTALTATLFDLALITTSGAISRSKLGNGGALALGLERRSRSFSVGGRAEWRSARFAAVEEPEERRARLTASAFVDYSFRGGSVGVNYYRRRLRLGDDEELVGGFASFAIGGGTFQFSARRAVVGRSNTIIGTAFALPFGGRRNAAVNIDVEKGRPTVRLSVQQNPPAGIGNSFRAAIETGAVDALQAQYVWQGPSGTLGVETAKVGRSTGVRLSLAGTVGLVGDRLFASRRLNSSFADVRVERYPGVRVYADNQLVGVTDSKGRLIVPNLRAYEANPIRIDDSDLPIDARLPAFDALIRPYAKSGVIVRFSPRRDRGVMMRVRLADGTMLPPGAEVTVEGRPGVHSVATGGELYIEGLSGVVRLTARWRGRNCSFAAAIPANDDPQPRLDGLLCREDRYAVR